LQAVACGVVDALGTLACLELVPTLDAVPWLALGLANGQDACDGVQVQAIARLVSANEHEGNGCNWLAQGVGVEEKALRKVHFVP
jgi:hypothetical protein